MNYYSYCTIVASGLKGLKAILIVRVRVLVASGFSLIQTRDTSDSQSDNPVCTVWETITYQKWIQNRDADEDNPGLSQDGDILRISQDSEIWRG